MVRVALRLLILAFVLSACEKKPPAADASSPSSSAANASADPRLPPFAERKPAPAGFDGSTAWLNVTRPLAKADTIRAYEARRRALEPWLFG